MHENLETDMESGDGRRGTGTEWSYSIDYTAHFTDGLMAYGFYGSYG